MAPAHSAFLSGHQVSFLRVPFSPEDPDING